MTEEYNGHPSYAHWNVALWVAGDERLYGVAKDYSDGESFAEWCEMGFPATPDFVEVTPELAEYAWDCLQKD